MVNFLIVYERVFRGRKVSFSFRQVYGVGSLIKLCEDYLICSIQGFGSFQRWILMDKEKEWLLGFREVVEGYR